MLGGGFGFKGGGSGGGTGWILIEDSGVIANLENPANWTTGVYKGSTAGLVDGNYYDDQTNMIRYTYLDGVVNRQRLNNV